MTKKQEKFVILMQEMSAHTAPECANACRAPHSCCDRIYCEEAIEEAHDNWGVELRRTDHPTIPLMGPNGCTAAPHFRVICTVHTCQINSLGCKPNDPEWTKKYFKIRRKIERAVIIDR